MTDASMNHQHERAGGETIHECEGRDLSQAAAFRFQFHNLLAAYQLLWTTELLAIRLRMPNAPKGRVDFCHD